jgi:hypothetical protein
MKSNDLVFAFMLHMAPTTLAWMGPRSWTLSNLQQSALRRLEFFPLMLSPTDESSGGSSLLSESNDDNNNVGVAVVFPSSSEKDLLVRQRRDTQELLDRIRGLKKNVLLSMEEDSSRLTMEKNDYQPQVNRMEQEVNLLLERDLVPPKGLTLEEYQDAMVVLLQMPFLFRYAFCEALGLLQEDSIMEEEEEAAAMSLRNIPQLVTLLYQQRVQLTPQRLQNALENVQRKQRGRTRASSFILGDSSTTTSSSMASTSQTSTTPPPTRKTGRDDIFQRFQDLFQEQSSGKEKSEYDIRMENTVKNVLGRVTRREGREATKKDLDLVLKALDKDTFVVSKTEKIPGGYVIRGKKNDKQSASALIEAIDNKLPEAIPAQVCFMQDVTTAEFMDQDPVLVLLNKDFSSGIPVLRTLCSFAALISAFAYCVGVYGANDVVAGLLAEATAVQDSDGISLFTNRVLDVLLPLLCIQVWHELAHFVAAKLNKMDMGIPTLLPFWSLPFMGAKTDLTSSPPNRSALFDFAIAGPLVGIVSSVGCLALGLILTGTADESVRQYFPCLPVGLMLTSTLGGSMVDYFLGGGIVGVENRFVTMQDPSTLVVLHPAAVAGYCGLLINALAMLPLGSTDGGRVSLAIFGRYGQTLVGALAWVSLLIASFTLERSDILIAAWVVNNVVQLDPEIPCRDETDEVNIPRALAGLSIWLVSLLAIIPLSS